MDLSPTNIKMLSLATEIQVEWRVSYGDWYYDPTEGSVLLQDNEQLFSGKIVDEIKRKHVWIPRIDQLHDIYNKICIGKGRIVEVRDILLDFSCRCLYKSNPYWEKFKSFEQLWLSFIMDCEYNKVWTGEEWKIAE